MDSRNPEQRDPYAELEAALQAGPTPGPWVACRFDPMERPHAYAESEIAKHNALSPVDLPYTDADARYIAAASPSVVGPLLRERERLRKRVQQLEEAVERLTRALRVAYHSPHDQAGEPSEGFPVCSACGAIQVDPEPMEALL